MRLTLPHYYDFGDDLNGSLDSAESWDTLRQTAGPFGIAADREALLRMVAERPEIAGRARAISALVDGSLASYGVGGGLLEVGLDVPRLVLTEFAPATVEQLRVLFPNARVVSHDLSSDGPLDADLHLFHRIDTEFTNREWRRIFDAFRQERIIFVPGGVQTPRIILREAYAGLRLGRTRAGRLRTRAAVQALWQRTHRGESVWLGDTEGWVLKPH